MGDADEAEDSDFENTVASVFADEDVDSESGDASLHLDVDPDQVLPIQKH